MLLQGVLSISELQGLSASNLAVLHAPLAPTESAVVQKADLPRWACPLPALGRFACVPPMLPLRRS